MNYKTSPSSARYILLLIIGLMMISVPAVANYPRPNAFVNDFAKLLNPETTQKINNWAIELKEKTDVELAIAILPDIDGKDENTAAVELYAQWKVGNKKDEGVLILLALKERRIKIETGYGSEGYLTDAFSGDVFRQMRERLAPGSENWDEAFSIAALMILNRIATEKGVVLTGVPSYTGRGSDNFEGSPIPILIVIVVFIFLVIVTKGKILEVLLWALILSGRGGGGRGGGSWGGGSGGSSSGGFGGFGGFGGGRSGGGGAGGGF